MDYKLLQSAEKYNKRHRRKRVWKKIVSVLGCAVVFCTTYALILPAITMEREVVCELSEHEHTEACYVQKIEYEHTEDGIQTVEQILDEPLLCCEQQEHAHGLVCYSNPAADKETASVWEDTLPPLSGNRTEDMVAVALSQLGYRESTSNYVVLEDGISIRGYTRYGEWYGAPYADWNTIFAAFCLHYAEVEDMPAGPDCQEWVKELQAVNMYLGAAESTPTAGSLVFFDLNEDGGADRVGIVENICDDLLKVIEGDSNNVVARTEYAATDPILLGYGILPEKVIPIFSRTAVIYTDSSYEIPADDSTIITLTGALPEEAQVRAFPVTIETDQRLLCAYDIAIVLPDGTLYESAENESVSVSIQTSELKTENLTEAQEVEVYYVPEEGAPELLDSVMEEESVCFDTDHFSVYMVLLAEEETTEQMLESAAVDLDTFVYVDDAEGFQASLSLNSSYYVPSKFNLVVRRMSEQDYSNALNTFTKHGQVIEEAAIYKVYLVDKTTGQNHTNLGCSYELEMSWANKLFSTVDSSDILNFTYCKNPRSEPTALNNCQIAYDDGGNITTLSTADSYYPNSAEFMFVRSSAPNGLVAGQSSLKYNEAKDAFLKDSEYSGYYNANSPIGTAGSFHIVAFEEAHLNTHTNGNVLARDLYAGSNFGTNGLKHELSYAQNYIRVHSTSASSAEHILVIGSGNTVDFVDNGNAFSINGTKIDRPHHLLQDIDTAKSPFIDLERVETEIRQISTRLNGMTDSNLTYTSAADLRADHSRLKLDKASGVGVIHYTAAELAEKLGSYVQIDGFENGSNGTVVINVDCTGATEINMPQARVVIDGVLQGTSEVVEFSAGKVIWNFVNAEGVLINTHLTTGMVVAPGATVNIKQNLNGTVVADKVLVNAESHRTDFTGTVEEPDVEVEEQEYYVTVRKIETGYAGSALPGAVFDLYKWENGTWNKVNTESLITSTDGTVTLRHLEKSVAYMLVETEAPDGYMLKAGSFDFWIKADKNQTQPNQSPAGYSGTALEVGQTLLAANDKSYMLPETGGVGTHMYTMGGWILIVLTGIILLYKYKKAERRISHLPDA